MNENSVKSNSTKSIEPILTNIFKRRGAKENGSLKLVVEEVIIME